MASSTQSQGLSKYVTLISSDGFEFIVLRDAACVSGAIKRMLDPTSECLLCHLTPTMCDMDRWYCANLQADSKNPRLADASLQKSSTFLLRRSFHLEYWVVYKLEDGMGRREVSGKKQSQWLYQIPSSQTIFLRLEQSSDAGWSCIHLIWDLLSSYAQVFAHLVPCSLVFSQR